ncbi:unannotated protein [freshwater metagenome]|uniref:Unannotated protein n=1 Tax=freshwater metagenome TaxID=449393 RepID=A0A6J6XIR5_9ZZZZ
MSSSTNDSGSSNKSRRSRAVSLPRACWRSTEAGLPACIAASRSAASCSIRASIGCAGLAGVGVFAGAAETAASVDLVFFAAIGAEVTGQRACLAPTTLGNT